MKSRPGHRKRIRHYHDPGHIHELTFSCYRRWPLSTNETWRRMLAESIDRATQRHRYRLAAFVFVPEHVHLMIYPLAEASTIDALLKAVKRPFSYRIKQLLFQSRSRLLERLTVHQRPGIRTFRYWQEGPGYDRNFIKPATVLAATGHRITYAEAKGLLILEGDGRNSAKLFRQAEAGADRSETAAKKFLYWLKTKQWKIDGAESLQFGLPPSGSRTRQGRD